MKRTVLLTIMLAMVACTLQAQQRDRRADLEVRCLRNAGVSSSGHIWMADRCGHVWTADGIHSTWCTVMRPKDETLLSGHTFDRVMPFGNGTAVVGGFIAISHYDGDRYEPRYDCVLRTTDGGLTWDTVKMGEGKHWVSGVCRWSDGRLWIGSSQATSPGHLFYSADSGRTFTVLRTAFDVNVKIEDIYMVSADSGFLGTYDNQLYSTSDNWSTFHRIPTPRDQQLFDRGVKSVEPLRPWKGYLIAIQGKKSFCTRIDTIAWRPTPLPLADFEVDTVTGRLWAVTDSGQLVLMYDMEHWRMFDLTLNLPHSFCGMLGGRVYLLTTAGVVRVGEDGEADTCGFYTHERTLEEVFDSVARERGEYVSDALPTFTHGGRIWRSDGSSIYLKDALGWYRIAKPLHIIKILPDLDRDDRVIILCYNNKNYSVDTAGHVEPYTYRQPLVSFVESGLKGVIIKTYVSGCFNYDEQVMAYAREGDRLCEVLNTVDSNRWVTRYFPADSIERTLLRLGERYSQFPTPREFGLADGDVDLEKVYLADHGWCTSGSGYLLAFINRNGDTLRAIGHSSVSCGNYFPWMLPMTFIGDSIAFVTYQPMLWQALLPMMPVGMMHRGFLSNGSLVDLRPGDLLFFADSRGMGRAIKESTGYYTHVAIVESVGDTVWVIDATPEEGVARRPLRYRRGFFPDVYRLKADIQDADIEPVLDRARSFIGQPYDNAFLPDNGAMYCSELVYECFLDDFHSGNYPGDHLFEAKPMNWRNAKGKLPRYWKKHFRKLKMQVPEGIPGTNPTDLSRSPLLRKL